MINIYSLIDKLIAHKGKIVSSASLSELEIAQAKAEGCFYISNGAMGFAWIPDNEQCDKVEVEAKVKLNFGQAIEALKEGKLIRRSGWNGKGMFVAKQIPAVIGLDIIPKMQSLPQAAKDKLINRGQEISYRNQMLIVNSEGIADSWTPSPSDCFAEDWEILN